MINLISQKNHSLLRLKFKRNGHQQVSKQNLKNPFFNFQEKGVLRAVTPDPWRLVYQEYFIFEFTYVVKIDLFSISCYFDLRYIGVPFGDP